MKLLCVVSLTPSPKKNSVITPLEYMMQKFKSQPFHITHHFCSLWHIVSTLKSMIGKLYSLINISMACIFK